MYIPSRIKEIIGGMSYSIETIGLSGSQIFYFDDMVLKIEKESEESDNEYRTMEWLSGKLPVPQILCFEKVGGINYLLMNKIGGTMACSAELLTNPNQLIKLLGDGLRMLWGVDVSKCPYNNLIDNKLKLAESRVLEGLCNMDDAEPATYGTNGFQDPKHLLEWLKDNRPEEESVFSHGDYCLPNIFVKDGKINGFIDLGRSGIADPYHDIALCYRSLKHNYNGAYGGEMYKGFDAEVLFDELELEPDWKKIKYYILLDELF